MITGSERMVADLTGVPVRHAMFVAVAAALTACSAPAPAPPPPPPATEAVPVPPRAPETITYPPTVAPPVTLTPGSSWTMPNLVGKGLQEAQDAIQELTGYGIVITMSHDATGANRFQLADRNWKVCTQNVPPGATITPQTRIDFGAVLLEEGC